MKVAEYTNYQSELKFLLEDKERMKYVANMIKQVSQTGDTLVLTEELAMEIYYKNYYVLNSFKGYESS